MKGIFSDLDEAMYAVIHEFKGGAVRLAPLVGLRPGTLSNKVNPEMDTHHLTVNEAVAIQNTAQDYRILYAEASTLGHTCIRLADFSGISDTELLDAYAAYHADLGETAQAIRDALGDGRVTRAEVARIRKEGNEDIQRWFELLARLEGLCDD